MESPSQAPHSGGSPWKGLLLTASILSCWMQLASTQSDSVSVVPNPPYGTVGSSVILDIQGASEQADTFEWYRETINNSNLIASYVTSSGELTTTDSRLNVSSSGSLLISNLTLSDTDDYIVLFTKPTTNGTVEAQAHLAVYEVASKPAITASRTIITENSTVVFTCVTEQEGMDTLWFFNDALLSLNKRKYLSENNKTLTIENVTREDAGSYQCEVWNPISSNRSDSFTLTVNYGPDNIMISPSPEGDVIKAKVNNPLTLVCRAESYPPAQYEWRVNGTVNSSDNTYTIDNVSWEDSGTYSCYAYNNITNLTISKNVTIMVAEESPGRGNGNSLSGGAIAGIVIGVLAGVALIGALIYFLFFR